MNRDAILAELQPATRAWLAAAPRDEYVDWSAVARSVAISLGRRLLHGDGEAGYANAATLRDSLRTLSPGVAAVVAQLPLGQRRWSAQLVARAVCAHLDLPNAEALRLVLAPRRLLVTQNE